jgi:hypothetical protein
VSDFRAIMALLFELLPFVNFHISFLARPLLQNYKRYGHETSQDGITGCTKTSTQFFSILEFLPFVDYNTLFLSRPFHLSYKSYGLETS